MQYSLIFRIEKLWNAPPLLPPLLEECGGSPLFGTSAHRSRYQGILTYSRYTQLEFKLKFSALLKAYDDKYTENSKKELSNNIAVRSVLVGVIYLSICHNSYFFKF